MPEDQLVSMYDENELKENEVGSVNLGRHASQCSICLSAYREEIEERWIGWSSTTQMAKEYNTSRDSIYRHMHALDLFRKRQRNIVSALEQIIERVDQTPTSGPDILSAIKLYEKMDSAEQGGEHVQGTDPQKLFKRMTQEERESFARDGSLPDWFSSAKGATPSDSQAGEKESQVTETKRLQ
jgi:hypothetical protein